MLCTSYTDSYCGSDAGFSCQRPDDQCGGNAHCGLDAYCTGGGAGPRVCDAYGCPVVGRPLLVAGEMVRASAVIRSDWAASVDVAAMDLGAELRMRVSR